MDYTKFPRNRLTATQQKEQDDQRAIDKRVEEALKEAHSERPPANQKLLASGAQPS